ncbi:hypothetical protein D9613_002790 [Agrocybe pediades]|uniref:Uncharacterized protein n=1 Tax=Agrocybe pediades TaxID=84607 RepID=A0A8H4VLK8_9AGAR|nr:hypothetical protein D9613_002790 [Agrocybe pediades]
MDAVKSSAQALEIALASRTQARRSSVHIKNTKNQLASTIQLLGLPTLTSDKSTQLAELLRQQLVPLYCASLSAALDYAISIFCFIHRERLTQLTPTKPRKYGWEAALKSLLSGILDFLEDDADAKGTHRDLAASTLFPILCQVFFATTVEPVQRFEDSLLSIAYMLLTTIADGHGKNVVKLREHIGSGRLGLTISQTRGFLALEAILDLFATLLPPMRGGRAKRTDFIDKVFDPLLYTASKQIRSCLESTSNPDWRQTAAEIMELLAQSDGSYPQRFEVYSLSAIKTEEEASFVFYMDEEKFVGNIDQEGNVDTFQIPFSAVANITARRMPIDKSLRISIRLKEPPILGDKAISTVEGEDSYVSWNMKHAHFSKFKECLKARKLDINSVAGTKQSKTDEIKLDFNTEKEDTLALKGEKIQSLSQLWKSNDEPSNLLPGPGPTSPLAPAPQSAPSSKIRQTSNDFSPIVPLPKQNISSPDPAPLFASCGDDPTDEPATRPVKSKRRVIITSDDEHDEALPPHVETVPKPQSTRNMVIDKSPYGLKDDSERSKEEITAIGKEFSPNQSSADRMPLPKSKKRKTIDEEEAVLVQEDAPPAKRGRRDNLSTPSPAPAHPFVKKKYGKQGRLSSPPPISGSPLPVVVDFDALPPLDPPKFRTAAMKRKGGRETKKTKQATVGSVRASKGTDRRVRARPSLDPDITLINPPITDTEHGKTSEMVAKEPEAKRRSARVANATISTNQVHDMNHERAHTGMTKKKKAKKAAKAIWEADDFMEKLNSDFLIKPLDGYEVQGHDLAADLGGGMIHVDDPLDGEILVADNILDSYSDEFTDVIVATKLGSSSNSTPSDPAPQSIVIDLTLEDSPRKKTKQNVDIPNAHPQQEVISVIEHANAAPSEEVQKINIQHEIITSNATHKAIRRQVQAGRSAPEPESTQLDVDHQSSIGEPEDIGQHTAPIFRVEKMHTPLSVKPAPAQTLREKDIAVDLSRGSKEKMPTPPPRKFIPPQPNTEYKVAFDVSESNSPVRGTRNSSANIQERYFLGRRTLRIKHVAQKRMPLSKEIVEEEAPMDRIVEILKEINEAVVSRVTERFAGVTEELHAGQRAILEGTADALQDMLHDRVRHFNELVDLEGEYTTRCGNINGGLQGYLKSSEQLGQTLKDVVLDHGRRSLSKKLPTTLLKKMPSIITYHCR